ncbi:MAG: leucine-rich repeat domain-containing protein, partial [candidate division KSB1 bacterium]|nr:leucine-rich repeat domain-containing protein [candidate division KSB1 bacterium]
DVGFSNNSISDISALRNATALKSLSMNNNQVADISPLQDHFQLQTLVLGNNQISDISALHNLTSLTTLYLHGNQIQDVTPLTNLVNLVDVYMPNNLINDLNGMQNLTNLQSLSLNVNQVTDLTPLQNLTNLVVLACNDNQIADVNPLQTLINLTTLYLGNNQIADIAGISGLVNLVDLRLDGNLLDNDDLPMMYDLDQLTSLDLRNNPGITSGTAMQALGDNLDSMDCVDILWDGICGEDPVPVELSSFNASERNGDVLLAWKTESESNSFGFQVERSKDNQQFQAIGFVAGRGTTTAATTYEFLDKKAGTGITYYRLKMIDLDGTFEYSGTIEIALHAPAAYRLGQNFPNPFNSKTMISFSVPEKRQVEIAVYDITGKQVMVLMNKVCEAGSYQISFDAKNLPSGTYYYKMTAGEFTSVQKLVVLK